MGEDRRSSGAVLSGDKSVYVAAAPHSPLSGPMNPQLGGGRQEFKLKMRNHHTERKGQPMKTVQEISDLPALSPKWRERLASSLGDVLAFSGQSVRGVITLRAESLDGRTILEVIERKRRLERMELQIALPEEDE